jgi:hypothetical protein
MLEKIALILDFAPFAVIFLIVACYNTHAIPRAMAKRIARREDSWDRDTVEEDRLGVLLFLTPAFGFAVPGLFRLVTGLSTAFSGWMIIMAGLFTAFVLYMNATPLLRYDSTGVYVRDESGKNIHLLWHQITSVQWQIGGSPNHTFRRARPDMPVVAVYYSSMFLGRPASDVCYLDPTTHRGISRFLAAWNARHPEEVLSNFDE